MLLALRRGAEGSSSRDTWIPGGFSLNIQWPPSSLPRTWRLAAGLQWAEVKAHGYAWVTDRSHSAGELKLSQPTGQHNQQVLLVVNASSQTLLGMMHFKSLLRTFLWSNKPLRYERYLSWLRWEQAVYLPRRLNNLKVTMIIFSSSFSKVEGLRHIFYAGDAEVETFGWNTYFSRIQRRPKARTSIFQDARGESVFLCCFHISHLLSPSVCVVNSNTKLFSKGSLTSE